MRELATILGTSPAYADELATAYWKDLYPRNPPEYRTPLCYDGGPLDLQPDRLSWP